MEKKGGANIIRCLLLLGILSFLSGGAQTLTAQTSHTSKTKAHSMSLANKTQPESPAIPPIDVAAPSIFKTASFGLG